MRSCLIAGLHTHNLFGRNNIRPTKLRHMHCRAVRSQQLWSSVYIEAEVVAPVYRSVSLSVLATAPLELSKTFISA